MRVRVLAGVVLSVSVLGACADPVSPAAGVRQGGPAPRGPSSAVGDTYEVTATDLRPLGLDRTPVDVNERGEMVGSCRDRANRRVEDRFGGVEGRAFLWSPAGGYRDLGTLGGAASCAAALSDAGHVAGYSQTADGAVRAFVWTAAGGMRDLGTLPGGAQSRALDVNDAGRVVGWSTDASGVPRAVTWDPDGAIQPLGRVPDREIVPFPGARPQVWQDSMSFATAINNRGQAVGFAAGVRYTTTGPFKRAFLWSAAGGIRDLTTAAEDQRVTGFNEPLDIGDGGTIVGTRVDLGETRGMLMDTTGAYFGPARGEYGAVFTGVNAAGQVVGYRSNTNSATALFVDAAGTRVLPAPPSTVVSGVPTEVFLHAISDRGEVVGRVLYSNAPVRWTVRVTPAEALLVDGNSGGCLDVLGESREPGAGLIIYDCHGGANQRFSYPAEGQTGEIRVYTGEGSPLCVDAWGAGTENGTRLVVWTCHGGANQQWTRTADGAFRGLQSGRCVDVLGARTENLTDVWLWDCFGAPNQRWDARAPSGGATLAAVPLMRPALAGH